MKERVGSSARGAHHMSDGLPSSSRMLPPVSSSTISRQMLDCDVSRTAVLTSHAMHSALAISAVLSLMPPSSTCSFSSSWLSFCAVSPPPPGESAARAVTDSSYS